MDTTAIGVLIAVVLIGAVVWITLSRVRSQRLRQRFGPEYERTVRSEGTVRKAEAALEARAKRVHSLHIHPLSPDDATRFDAAWRDIQTRFVDEPRATIAEADRLVGEVMATRGYPVGEFEQRVEDISVDHPDVVMNYRAAREIAQQHAEGKASTEDLRQAMVHYRALFRDLLETKEAKASKVREIDHPHRETPVGRP